MLTYLCNQLIGLTGKQKSTRQKQGASVFYLCPAEISVMLNTSCIVLMSAKKNIHQHNLPGSETDKFRGSNKGLVMVTNPFQQ